MSKELLKRLYENLDYGMKVYFVRENGRHFKGFGEYADFSVDTYNNDCQVGNFGLNFWFRTRKGMNYERYSSVNHMINAIKQKAKDYGLIMVGVRFYIQRGVKKRVIKELKYGESDVFENMNYPRYIFEL